jgi:uroporphyrinogen III methyltransferase/synthase
LGNVRPLAGKRIVVTRAREQAGVLADALTALGAEVVRIPTIEIRNPDSWEPLDRALRQLEEFDFLLVTSSNGARNFLARLHACGRDIGELAGLEIGAIGPATAAELENAGVTVDFIPREYRAEGLLEVLGHRELSGKAFLIPRAKVARDLVPRALEQKGASVVVVEAYETAPPAFAPGELDRLLTPPPDVVTFTSSSTASNFVALLGQDRAQEVLNSAAVASIGPVTSDTIRELKLAVTVEAKESTIPGLVEAVRVYFSAQRVAR